MPLNKSWHDCNESLIECGYILIDIVFLRSEKKMNQDMVAAPFEYSDTYIEFLAILNVGFKVAYRTIQGMIRGLSD